MSRHRNIRQMNYQQDYDDYYNNDFSDEDDYLYDVSDKNENLDQSNEQNKINFKVKKSKFRMPTDANKIEKLMTCVSELKTIFGDSFSDEDYKTTATKYNYDFSLAYDFLMNGNDKKNTQKQEDQNKKKDIENRLTELSCFIKKEQILKKLTKNKDNLAETSKQKTDDDFESMFLSDIDLDSSKKKKSVISCVKNFKNEKPVLNFSLSSNSNNSNKNLDFLDNIKKDEKYLNSLKDIPLLNINKELRNLMIEEIKKIKHKNSGQESESFVLLGSDFNKNSYRYKFDVIEDLKKTIENYFKNSADELLPEVNDFIEIKKIDQQNRVSVHLKKENKNSTVEKSNLNKQTKNLKDNLKNNIKNDTFKNPKVEIKVENTPKNKVVPKLDLDSNVKEYKEKRADSKNTVNLVVIGHVDSGKSTLMGHLLVKMGYVSNKNLHSYQTESKKIGKSSFSFAWVLDQTDEERKRGITIDVAHLSFETETKNIMLLDAPGHRDFIPNMITGASQADAALLVVDATTNEFESGFLQGGQTKEHTMLIKSFGITQLAVVINKLDNVKWSEERFVEIEKQLKPFIKQVGFKLSSVSFIPCSGILGENLSTRSTIKELTSWYTGPCLLEIIETFKPSERLLDKHLRFFVNSVYKNIGLSGINLSGKVEAGAIRVNQKLVIRPNNETCTVKTIKLEDKLVQTAFAGDRVEICLSNVDEFCLRSRYVLCSSESLIPIVSHIEAKIVVFSNVIVPITAGMDIVFHYKTSNVNACVFKLLANLDRSTGEVIRSNPRCLSKNTSGVVEIKLNKPICLELYQNYKELGRFMLRSNGVTIAAGIVNKILKEESLSKDF